LSKESVGFDKRSTELHTEVSADGTGGANGYKLTCNLENYQDDGYQSFLNGESMSKRIQRPCIKPAFFMVHIISLGILGTLLCWITVEPLSAQSTPFSVEYTEQTDLTSKPTLFSDKSHLYSRNLFDKSNIEIGAAESNATLDSPNIIGGIEAREGAWPWQVALVRTDEPDKVKSHFCGGALIASDWIITAAHCVEYMLASQLKVIIGRHDLSTDLGKEFAVNQVVVHPEFGFSNTDSDIALLHLDGESDQPIISLDAPDSTYLEENRIMGTVTGWGRNSVYSFDGSSVLRQVSLPIVSNEVCNTPDAHNGEVTDNMLCAGFTDGSKTACHGDSGGPLMVRNLEDTEWTQIGIVSWGSPQCSGSQQYNVYTRVAEFKNWVKQLVESAWAKITMVILSSQMGTASDRAY